MKNKFLHRNLYCITAFAVSVLLCTALFFLLVQKMDNDLGFAKNLNNLTPILIGISGFFSGILIVFLASSAIHLKSTKARIISKINKITQKMHHFRSIAEILFHSNIWLPGLKEYMEKEFTNLTYFDVKEFYKGKSRQAIEFLQETHHFGETENLYLEMKSLLMTNPDERRIPNTISHPIFYDPRIVKKWAEHQCGSGLGYVFGFKFGDYRESLNLEAVLERHQEKILTLANTIDSDEFEDASFNEVFFAKLWEYMSKDVIPKLYQFHSQIDGKISRLVRYLYLIFLILLVFGVLLPLLYCVLNISIFFLILAYSTVISTIFFIATSFHVFLFREANHNL